METDYIDERAEILAGLINTIQELAHIMSMIEDHNMPDEYDVKIRIWNIIKMHIKYLEETFYNLNKQS